MSVFARRIRRSGHVPTSSGWLSGAAGDEAADGSFNAWRGTPIAIGGTWMDTNATAQTEGPSWVFNTGTTWGAFNGYMDIAPGAIWIGSGESWASAASGAYDARWTTFWTNLAAYWAPRDPSKLFVRFAHEFNLTGSDWTVAPGQQSNFITAWQRWHSIKQSVLPTAKLTWCPNAGNNYGSTYDIRSAYPGDAYVDVIGVDWYNNWPWVNTAPDFLSKINMTQSFGAPEGIEQWRLYALSRNKPMAICEWSSAAFNGGGGGGGDAPVFMEQFYAWCVTHGGSGAGQLRYEVLFNIPAYTDSYMLYPTTDQPLAAQRYRELF